MKDSLRIGAFGIACIVFAVACFVALAGAMTGAGVLWVDVHPVAGVLFFLCFIFVSIAAVAALP